jgi:M6 family metalloprotease-like protein
MQRQPFLSAALTVALTLPAGSAAGEWLSTSRPIGAVAEVAAGFEGGVAHWSKTRFDRTVEHLAGRTSAGALQVFSWGPGVAFQRDDVTAKTGISIAGTPIAWAGALDREHVAALGSTGAVTLFTWTPATGWTAVELSAGTGKVFTGNLVRWVTPEAPPTEHLAATTSTGEILVFERIGGGPFTTVDVTAASGLRSPGGLGGGWSVAGTFEDHLVAVGADGKLYELVSPPWKVKEIPLPAGHKVTSDLTAWWSDLESVAVRTERNVLLVLSRSLDPRKRQWVADDLTTRAGEEVTGRPAFYQAAEGAATWDALAVPARNGRALVYWRTGWSPLWQQLDLTELTGAPLAGAPAAWSPDVVAGTGPDKRLRLVSGFTAARALTERVTRPLESLSPQTGVRKTLTLLWHPETTAANCTAATGTLCKPGDCTEVGQGFPQFPKANAEAALQRVADYFRENSGGLLTLENDRTLGWFTSRKPFSHYRETHGSGGCMDGWSSGDVEKLVEAVRQADAADPALDFSAYDEDRDGRLSPGELTVIVMTPAASGGGLVRAVEGGGNPPLEVDGVVISRILELDVAGGQPHLGLLARELSRHLFGHVDMTWEPPAWPHAKPPSTALGALALMDGTRFQGHHDAFTKLKLGWAVPYLMWRTGSYTLPDVETGHVVRVLVRPDTDGNEFLVFENRFRGTSFDQGLPADGLAIYHVLQYYRHPAIRPPYFLSAADWGRFTDWGHRAVRLLRPPANGGHASDGGSASAYDDARSLWRRDTGFTLEPFLVLRERAWLRWSDLTNPELAIRDLSAPGREMTFSVAAVPARELCTLLGKNCDPIADPAGGAPVHCGTCEAPESCNGGGIANVCGCARVACGNRCGEVADGCGGVIQCECGEEFYCSWLKQCERIPPPCSEELCCDGTCGPPCGVCPP